MKPSTIIISAITLLSAVGCGNVKTPQNDISGRWRICAYNPITFSSFHLVDADGEYILTLREDGTFCCNTDCNTISGRYSAKNESIGFKEITYTELACENDIFEQSIKTALPSIQACRLSEDSILSMSDKSGNTILKLEPVRQTDQSPDSKKIHK